MVPPVQPPRWYAATRRASRALRRAGLRSPSRDIAARGRYRPAASLGRLAVHRGLRTDPKREALSRTVVRRPAGTMARGSDQGPRRNHAAVMEEPPAARRPESGSDTLASQVVHRLGAGQLHDQLPSSGGFQLTARAPRGSRALAGRRLSTTGSCPAATSAEHTVLPIRPEPPATTTFMTRPGRTSGRAREPRRHSARRACAP